MPGMVNHGQISMAREVIRPRVETAIAVLLSDHVVKLPSNCYNHTNYRPWLFSALFREASFKNESELEQRRGRTNIREERWVGVLSNAVLC